MFLAKIPRGVKAFRFDNEYKLKLNNVIIIDCLTCLLAGVGELCVVGMTVEGLVVGDVLANHLGRIRQRIQTLDRSILTPGQLGIDALQTLVRTEVSGLGIGQPSSELNFVFTI
jgi:hypothetical protein